MTAPDIDVSEWSVELAEPMGTKPKQWLRDPEDQLWLFKEVTFNHKGGALYPKGDDWAEKAAELVAVAIGVPSAEIQLAHRYRNSQRIDGIVSKLVYAEGETLVHGNELLGEFGLDLGSGRRIGYRLEDIAQVLAPVEPPEAHTSLVEAWDWFVGYLVLDAVVGNTDRHDQNWAVIQNGRRRLAPTFDHASCLGFLLRDDERIARLTTNDGAYTVQHWASRAQSPFDARPHPVELAMDGLRMAGESARHHWLSVLQNLPEPDEILDAIPSERMSDASRQFAVGVVRTNLDHLLSHAAGSL